MTHRSTEELEARLGWLRKAPKNGGRITGIVIRPRTNQRASLTECEVSPERGVHGDNWASRGRGRTPNPAVQITIISTRMSRLLAVEEEQQALAGDQFFLDMDLSKTNLKVGQRLRVGTAVLEISPIPHRGCLKFSNRFGRDALQFVNSETGLELRLRGVYAEVVTPGSINVGSVAEKI